METSPLAKQVFNNFLTTTCYVLTGWIAYLTSMQGLLFPSILWFPGGISVVAILLGGFTVLPGIWLGSFLINLFLFAGWLNLKIWFGASMLSLAAVLQAVLVVWLVQTYLKTKTPFYRVRDVFLFSAITFFATLIRVLITFVAIVLAGLVPELAIPSTEAMILSWLGRWFAFAGGILVITPIIMIWYQTKIIFIWREILELFFLSVAIAIIFIIIYQLHVVFSYILISFCVLAAVRLRPQIAYLVAFLISALGAWLQIHFHEYEQQTTMITDLVFAETFILVTFFTTLVISAIVSEQKAAHTGLKGMNLQLEERVAKRTQDLAQKNVELNKTSTMLKSAQAQLVQAEKMSSLGILTAGIAHEINNPLNFVTANAASLQIDLEEMNEILTKFLTVTSVSDVELTTITTLLEKIDVDFTLKEVDKLMEGIEEGVGRTIKIIKSLRTFSRLDQNVLEKVNLHEYIDATLNLLANQYKNRITVIRNYDGLPLVECYPDRINQVFMNILQNAIQAIPETGNIIITTKNLNESIMITVKDNGIGMSEQTKDKIFEPFFTTKDVGQGTGLGLSISYGIIQEHAGTIMVTSEVGKGSEFIIQLPIKGNKVE